MKIDNILNKEKSPDKATIAERTSSSIEDIKRSQKFYDFNDLSAATNINNNLLQEPEPIYDYLPPSTSKLKKLLLNNDPDISSDLTSGFLYNNNNSVINSASTKNNLVKANNESVANNRRRNNNNVAKRSAKNVSKQKFLCSECNEYFLKLHLFNHIKSVHNKFTCLYCYGFFVDVGALEKHLVKKHKVQNTTFFDEQSLQNFLNPKSGAVRSKIIMAVCFKCGSIFELSGDGHSCCNEERIAEDVPEQQNHVEQHQTLAAQSDLTEQHPTLGPAKEDFYCDQAIQQWCQPNFKSNELELEQVNNVNTAEPPSPPPPSSQYQNVVPPENDTWHIEQNKPSEEKQVVPKLMLKIPKAFQNQQFDNVESEMESGDEASSTDDESNKSESFSQNLSKSNDHDGYSSSLSDTDNEANDTTNMMRSETVKPDNLPPLPSLKLKIKNLASNNPESVLENFDFPPASDDSKSFERDPPNDVDMSDCPMDLEPTTDVSKMEEEPEPEPPKLIIIDGVIVTPANEDVLTLDISLDEGLEKISIVKLMKTCLKASFPFCLYCNHARKIVVNGRALATHFITHHRFHAMVDSITAEELHPEKIVSKFESSVDELRACYFNLETFDNQDEEKKEGHVTISHDKLYECFQCRFQTPVNKELYLHNRKMHQKSLINCLMCKMSFYSYSELLCHICPGVSNKQMFLDYKFYCCLCNLDNIPSAFRLMVHLRKKHYACDVCLEKCSDQSKLSSHVWKHKLNHLCYRCNMVYRNKADIMKHLFWKHGTEGIVCKKCLQKKWPHVYHFCIPPAAFTCLTCEMSFTRAMALNVHMRLHEDGAKYPCSEMECEKKFVSKKLLRRHLERHQQELAAGGGENADQERPEGTVLIPPEIPEGCCTRTMPVVFKRITRKPVIRRIENEAKTELKPEAELKKEDKDAKALHDLPETNLNLSESSDSSSSEDEEDDKNIKSLAARLEAQIEDSLMMSEEPEADDKETSETAPLAKVSSLSDSDDDDEDTKKKDVPIKDEVVGVDDNSVLIKDQKTMEPPTTELKTEAPPEETKKEEKEVEDKLPEKAIVHVCQSDHDYAILFGPPEIGPNDDIEDMLKIAKIDKRKRREEKAIAKAARKNRPKNEDFSSSSSSGSSSSNSSSSSGSSSTSSGTSSDSSSSEASLGGNTKKPRAKKFSKKRSKKDKKVKGEPEVPEVPRDPDDIIYESDLVTDESDTDEDFYDEHPLKLDSQLAEKRKQLLKGGMIDGIVENSRPSTPSLPPDEKIEKKMKKKRKKEHRKSSSPSKRSHNDSNAIVNPGDASMNYYANMSFNHHPETPHVNKIGFSYQHTSTPNSSTPRIELHQANQIRQLLQSTQQQPVLPILKEQHYYYSQASNHSYDYVNVSHVPSIASSATSSRKNSDSEQANLKRSQRKRIPNKFYGYTSGDESIAAQAFASTNESFKPIPPPNLTWAKEDLPTKNKSPSSTPRIAPLKLNLTGDPLQQQLHTFAVEHTKQAPSPHLYEYGYNTTTSDPQQMPANVPHYNLSATVNPRSNRPSDTDSSDDDQLHISEPRRRKRKLPSQANSMYAFHTLETPPTVAQPPIPRLKLTIGSNNKIRRRNINPLKVSAAKKRKLANVGQKKTFAAPPPTAAAAPPDEAPIFARGSFNPYAKQYDSQPPMRLLQSPTLEQPYNQEAMSSRQMLAQEKLEKQQKLEEAILNTQQYFQRFNHTQVASSDIAQDNAEGDGRVYCYCRRPYDDLQGMIGCDGSSCQIEWFHFECVGILVPPKGNWYCPECQKEQLTF